jgi:hypothetical protein
VITGALQINGLSKENTLSRPLKTMWELACLR